MKKISILFMLLLGITTLYAQQLNITGTVIDKNSTSQSSVPQSK